MTTHETKTRRIGPQMAAAVQYVRHCGGAATCMLEVAEAIGPHGSRQYGYAAVHRAIRAGLLRLDPLDPAASPHGLGAVVEAAAP